MIVHLKSDMPELTPEQQELMYWAELRMASHKWEEYAKGYFQCAFCGAKHTDVMDISIHKICMRNPNLKHQITSTPEKESL